MYIPLYGASVEKIGGKMIKLFYGKSYVCSKKETILNNLFSKWFLFIYREIGVCEVFLIRLF